MRTEIKVNGMHCNSCEFIIEEALEEIGVRADASHEKGTIKVEFNESEITLGDISKVVREQGYKVV